MKVAVITPYHGEPIGTLKRCMSSVENQSHKVTHILVSDGSSINLYREVEKALVLEVAFDSIHASTRHKSGLAMRFPRISRIRTDKPAAEADSIATLMRLAT